MGGAHAYTARMPSGLSIPQFVPDAWWPAAVGAVLCGAWYALLLTGFSLDMLSPVDRGLVFNSMLLHMLDGRVDVDPAIITGEGFVREGRTYAYFGAFPALLRLPLLLVPGAIDRDITTLSTWIASVLACYWLLRATLVMHVHLARPDQRVLLAWLAVALALGGPQVQFLRASIYQEVANWAAAFGAFFVCACVRGLVAPGGFTPAVLRRMALAAGLALATRVSTGMGLYAAMGMLMPVLAWPGRLAAMPWLRALLAPRMLAPVGILAALLAWTLVLNHLRWGNPFTVADATLQTFTHVYEGRFERLQQTGMFNLSRVWLGGIYYFVPVWILYLPGGRLLLEPSYVHMAELELPPASFLLSDPLLLVLAGAGILGGLRQAALRRWLLVFAPPLLLPPILMLGWFFMNHRYRLEFYPLFTLLAVLGVMSANTAGGKLARWAPTLAIVSVLGAHGLLFLYVRSRFGPAAQNVVQDLLARLGL